MYFDVFFQDTVESLTCAACQGTLGNPCDVAPWTVAAAIPCEGRCITWRSLYTTSKLLCITSRLIEIAHRLFRVVIENPLGNVETFVSNFTTHRQYKCYCFPS